MRNTEEYKNHKGVLIKHSHLQVNEFDTKQLCQTFGYFLDACILSPRDQEIVTDLLDVGPKVIDIMFSAYDKCILPPLKQGLQFLAKLASNNPSYLWLVSKKHFIKWMSFKEEEEIVELLCGIMINIVHCEKIMAQEVARTGAVLEPIIDAALANSCNAKKFLHDIWYELDTEGVLMGLMFHCEYSYRMHTLNAYHNFIKKNDPTLYYVKFLKNGLVNILSKSLNHMSDMEIAELQSYLKIIITCSCNEKYVKVFQDDLRLLELVKSLLESVHNEGKNPDSMFAPNEKFFNDESIVRNLKSSLVRLLANLCWQNEKTQNKIREINGIPLILDCSKRDGNNPFITETVVFALKNICQDNIENQNFIRRLNVELPSWAKR